MTHPSHEPHSLDPISAVPDQTRLWQQVLAEVAMLKAQVAEVAALRAEVAQLRAATTQSASAETAASGMPVAEGRLLLSRHPADPLGDSQAAVGDALARPDAQQPSRLKRRHEPAPQNTGRNTGSAPRPTGSLDVAVGSPPDRASRRRWLGGAVAGLGLLAGGSAAASVEAAPSRNTNDPLLIGHSDNRPTDNTTTLIINPPGAHADVLFAADNTTGHFTAFPTAQYVIALAGSVDNTPSEIPTGQTAVGIYGKAGNTGFGIIGTAANSGTGVLGTVPSAGVAIRATALDPSGIGVVVDATLPLKLMPRTASPVVALPSTNVGGVYMQGIESGGPGALWFCGERVGASSVVIWRRVAYSQQAGVFVGITPVRILDTRAPAPGIVTTGFDAATGNPISAAPFANSAAAPDISHSYRVAGKAFGVGANAITFPADARAILCNVTVVQNVAGGGFVSVFAADVATPPTASTLNPSPGISFNLWFTNLALTGATAGSLTVRSVGDQPRDVIIDALGYYF